MSAPIDSIIRDATALYAATRALLGYRLTLRFGEVLTGLLRTVRRWWTADFLGEDGRPNARFRRVCLDFTALDPEPLWDLCGTCFYILASHKAANYRLKHPGPHPLVLYLRGFDYDAAVGVADGMAMGVATVDDARFLAQLERTLAPHAALFKVLSSRDLEVETTGMEQLFRGDYRRIIDAASAHTRSFYLNTQRSS
jgi:hypothetical protein